MSVPDATIFWTYHCPMLIYALFPRNLYHWQSLIGKPRDTGSRFTNPFNLTSGYAHLSRRRINECSGAKLTRLHKTILTLKLTVICDKLKAHYQLLVKQCEQTNICESPCTFLINFDLSGLLWSVCPAQVTWAWDSWLSLICDVTKHIIHTCEASVL